MEAKKPFEVEDCYTKHKADEQYGAHGGNRMHEPGGQRPAKYGFINREENMAAVEQGDGQKVEHGQRQIDENGKLKTAGDSAIPNFVPPATSDTDRPAETANANTRLFVMKQRVICIAKHLRNFEELCLWRGARTNDLEIHSILQFDTDTTHILVRLESRSGHDHHRLALAHDS